MSSTKQTEDDISFRGSKVGDDTTPTSRGEEALLTTLLSDERRSYLLQHDAQRDALHKLNLLLQDESHEFRERLARLLDLVLPSRVLNEVAQGGVIFKEEQLGELFRVRLEALTLEERRVLALLALLRRDAPINFLERVLDHVLPEVNFFEAMATLHEQGMLVLAHDGEGVEARVTLTTWMRGFLLTSLSGEGESRVEGIDFEALTRDFGRFLAVDFQPHLEAVIFLGEELDRERIELHLQELLNVYQSAKWCEEHTTSRGVIEQLLVLHALSTANWSSAHELTRRWTFFEQPHQGGTLASTREERTAACLYLRVLALSDNPARALLVVRQWLQELSSQGATAQSLSGVMKEELDRFRVALIVEAVETASRSEHFDHIDPLLEQGFGLCQNPSMRVQRGRLLLMSGVKSVHQRDWPRAQAMFQEAERLFSLVGHVRLLGHAHYHLGHIYKHLHRDEQCLKAYEEARELAMRSQDLGALTEIHRELVWTWLDKGEWEQARVEVDMLEALLAEYEESARIKGVASMLKGQLSMQRGELQEALVEFELARWNLASSQQQYLLVATFYFEFLCYWALDNKERARAYLELGEHLSQDLTSMMAQTCYGCAKIMVHIWDEELEEAKALVDALRELHATSMATSWLTGLLDVHEFHVHLSRYLQAVKGSKKKAIKTLNALLLQQGIDLQLRANRGAQVTDFNAEVRFCWAHVKDLIPASLSSMIELGLVDPTGEALIVDRAQQMFRAPDQNTWVHMKRRSTPFKLLCTLVEQRLQQPGVAIDASELFERVWPGESILQESAQNRLYVTINGLRKEGLKEILISTPEGYMLKQSVRLIDI